MKIILFGLCSEKLDRTAAGFTEYYGAHFKTSNFTNFGSKIFSHFNISQAGNSCETGKYWRKVGVAANEVALFLMMLFLKLM